MTSELTRVFSKSFVIGFVLPAAAFLLAVFGILAEFHLADNLLAMAQNPNQSQNQHLSAMLAALVLFVVWLAAVTLLALNRPITRILEGYGWLNPFQLNRPRMRAGFKKLSKQVADGRRKREEARKQERAFEGKDLAQYRHAVWLMAKYFPDDESHLLPTRFGNAIRAFEVYSRIVYGIESVYGWTRLVSVIPSEYREMIDNEKAQMDFWVNLWFGSCLSILVYSGFIIAALNGAIEKPSSSLWISLWIPAAAAAIAFFAAHGAHSVAQSWGILVTSAFDLFRSDLCRSLGFKMPTSIEEERELWQGLSQVWTYRSAEIAARLNKFRLPN